MQAVGLLEELGYTNVRHYPGGLTEWFERAVREDTQIGLTPSARAESVSRPRSPRSLTPANLSLRFIDALADRSVGTLFRMWLGMVAGCGLLYWVIGRAGIAALISNGRPLASGGYGLVEAVYFSAVTATSVGYGDIVPIGVARALAIGEGIAGLILFGCVVSKFVSRRQDQLIGEIHHIAFEDRLGRVRTNLHLVRTEVQSTLRLCEGRDMAPPEAIARVESAAMVFVGELHAVHDLLYRPQQTPDEATLEAILALLVSVFREFKELLMCVGVQRLPASEGLRLALATMSRLAREICGDCVPHEYAPSLRAQMDQIQRMARSVSE
jgi:hypothetical protein